MLSANQCILITWGVSGSLDCARGSGPHKGLREALGRPRWEHARSSSQTVTWLSFLVPFQARGRPQSPHSVHTEPSPAFSVRSMAGTSRGCPHAHGGMDTVSARELSEAGRDRCRRKTYKQTVQPRVPNNRYRVAESHWTSKAVLLTEAACVLKGTRRQTYGLRRPIYSSPKPGGRRRGKRKAGPGFTRCRLSAGALLMPQSLSPLCSLGSRVVVGSRAQTEDRSWFFEPRWALYTRGSGAEAGWPRSP